MDKRSHLPCVRHGSHDSPAAPGPKFTQVDPAGITYYMDLAGDSIFRVNADGSSRLVAGAPPDPSNSGVSYSGEGVPANIAIMRAAPQFWLSPTGEFWIADVRNQRVRKVDRNGIIRTVAARFRWLFGRQRPFHARSAGQSECSGRRCQRQCIYRRYQ